MVGLLGSWTGTATAVSGTNKTLNFQGRLLTNTGQVVADGTYNMRFKVYCDGDGVLGGTDPGSCTAHATNEHLFWTEEYRNSLTQGVVVKNGYFSVALGTYCAFDGSACTGGQTQASNAAVDWNQTTLWLSMDVGGTSAGAITYNGEMTPYKRLTSAVYALNAGMLGGMTASQFAQLSATQSFTGTNTFSNAAGIILSGTPASGGSLLQAGSALSGGSASGTLIGANTAIAGDLINLQVSNSTKFKVDNAGNVTSGTVNGVTLASNALTFSAAGAATIQAANNQNLQLTGQGTGDVVVNGDADTNLIVNQTAANDAVDINVSNGSGTAPSAIAITKSGAGTLTNGLLFTGTIGTDINRTDANALTVKGTSGVTIQAGGTTTASIDTAGAGTVAIGNGNATTVNIGNAGGVTNTLNIGSNALSNSSVNLGSVGGTSSTLIQGGGNASGLAMQVAAGGTVSIGTANSSNVYVGNASSTGTIILGQSTDSNTIQIGNGNTATGKTQTIQIGNGTPAGTGAAAITVGNTSNASAVSLLAGTGNINLTTNNASGGTIVKSGTSNSSLAFQVQNASNAPIFAVGTINNTAANTAWSGAQINVTNAQATTAVSTGMIAGLDLQFTQNASVLGNTETVANLAVKQIDTSVTDNTVSSILNLANNDTATGNQVTVTDGLKIQGTNVTNGINLSGTFGTNLITSSNFVVTQGGAITSGAWQGTAVDVAHGGTGLTSTTAWGVLIGGTTSTGALQNIGAGTAGQILQSNGPSAAPSWVGSAGCSTCVAQVPTTTLQNTITPATTGVVGLTVNNTSTGTVAQSLIVNQSGAADAANINVTGNSQTNGLSITRTNAGTLTNGLSITNSSGTVTNGILFTGTVGTDINRTDANALTIRGTSGVTIQAGGTTTASLDTAGAGTASLGATNAATVTVGNSTGTHTTTIQGGNTSSAVSIQTAASGTVAVATANVANSVQIGNTANAVAQTIGIGNNATAGSQNTVTVGSQIGASATTLQAGTGNMNLAFTPNIGSWTLNSTGLSQGGGNLNRVRGGTVATNGYIYHIGGIDGAGTLSSVVQYAKINADGSVGTFALTSALPVPLRQFEPVVLNGYVYVIGGHDGSAPVATAYYAKINGDGTLGTWRSTTPLTNGVGGIARFAAATVAANGYIFVIGGFNNVPTPVSSVYSVKQNADGSLQGTWISQTALSAGLSATNGVVANGYVYLPGGFLATGPSDTDTIYHAKLNSDGTVGTWVPQASKLPSGGDENVTAFVSNGYLYAVGGDNVSNDGAAYPIDSSGNLGAAVSLPNFPLSSVGEAGFAQYNGYFYLVGGSTGTDGATGARTSVYYASTARLKVGGNVDLVGYGSGDLADGGTGGSLTAGNTNIVGTFEVRGTASFASNATVAGMLQATGLSVVNNDTSAVLFQVLDSSNKTILAVDPSNEWVTLGKGGTGNLNGKLVFNTTSASSFTSSIAASGSQAATYDYILPISTASAGQCLAANSVSLPTVNLGWANCNGISTTPTSTAQNTIQPATSGVVALTLNGTNTGTAAVALDVNQGFAADASSFDITAGTGSAITVGSTINPAAGTDALIFVKHTNASVSGNLIDLQSGASGSETSKFKVASTGAVSIAAGASYTGAGAVTVQSGGATNLTLDAGGAASVSIGDANATIISVGTNAAAHTINIGTGGAAQAVTVGSTNTISRTTIQGGNITTTNGQAGVVVGGGYSSSDTNLDALTLDSSSTFAETASTCTASVNGGAMYYNSAASSGTQGGSNAIRACINGAWEDLVSTAGMGIMLFGVVPDSGSNPGDLPASTTAGQTGPCRVNWASATTVTVTPCVAYSGGRKVTVSSTTLTLTTTTTNLYENVCLTGTNSAPAMVGPAAALNSSSIVPAFSVANPVLCLAQIKNGTTTNGSFASGGQVYDVRTFTNTQKDFVTQSTTLAGLGQFVVPGAAGSTTTVRQSAASTTISNVLGVLVATSGVASSTSPTGIIATTGPAYVMATAGTAGDYVTTSGTTAGFGATTATAGTTNFGINRTSWLNTCNSTSTCLGSLYFNLKGR